MTISMVQSIAQPNGNSTFPFSSTITVGNTVFIVLGEYDNSTTETITAVKVGTTAQPNAEVLLFPQINVTDAQGLAILMIPNIQVSGQTTVSWTYSGASIIATWGCEVSGLGANPVLNQYTDAAGATSTIIAGTTPASTVANAFVLAGAATYNGTSTPPTQTWANSDIGINSHLSTGWEIQTTIGQTYAWTQATGGTEGWGAGIVVVSPSPSLAQPTVLGQGNGVSTQPMAISTTAGNAYVVTFAAWMTNTTPFSVTSVTDTAGNVWNYSTQSGVYDTVGGAYSISGIAWCLPSMQGTGNTTKAVTAMTVNWSETITDWGECVALEITNFPSNAIALATGSTNTPQSSVTSYTMPSITPVTTPTGQPVVVVASSSTFGEFTAASTGYTLIVGSDTVGGYNMVAATGSAIAPVFTQTSNEVPTAQTVAFGIGVAPSAYTIAAALNIGPTFLASPLMKTAALIDAFSLSYLSSARWSRAGTVAVTGDVLDEALGFVTDEAGNDITDELSGVGWVMMQCDTAYSSYLASNIVYDLTNSYLFMKLIPYQATSAQTMLQASTPAGDALQFGYSGGLLYADVEYPTGTYTAVGSTTYNATSHAWVRIREASGIVYFDTAPDGATWTNQWSYTPEQFTLTAVYGGVYAGDYGTDPTGWSYFTSFNVVSSVALTSSATLAVTPTFSVTRIHGRHRTATSNQTPTFVATKLHSHPRSATSTQTPTFSTTRIHGHGRHATLSEIPNFSATKLHGHPRSSTMSQTPTFSAGHHRGRVRSALESVIPSFVATKLHGHPRSATLSEFPSFVATKKHGHPRSASLTPSPTFSSGRVHGRVRTALKTITPTFSATGIHGHIRQAISNQLPTFYALASIGGPAIRSAIMSVTPSFVAHRLHGHGRSATSAQTPTFVATKNHAHPRHATMAQTPSFSAHKLHGHPRLAALSVTPTFSGTKLHGHLRLADLGLTPTFSAGRKRGHIRLASLSPSAVFSAMRSHGHKRGVTLAVLPTMAATAIVHGATVHSVTSSIAIACNAYAGLASDLTISAKAGAPYQGNMRQLAPDRWNYMYPSE